MSAFLDSHILLAIIALLATIAVLVFLAVVTSRSRRLTFDWMAFGAKLKFESEARRVVSDSRVAEVLADHRVETRRRGARRKEEAPPALTPEPPITPLERRKGDRRVAVKPDPILRLSPLENVEPGITAANPGKGNQP